MLALAVLLVSLAGATEDQAAAETEVTVPFTWAHGLVFVPLEMHATGLLALLDTGASASAIDPRRSEDLEALETSEVLGTTGVVPVEMVLLEGLALQSLELPPLRATRRDLGGLLAPEGRAVDMILGSDAFRDLALTLDFAAREMVVARAEEGVRGGVPMDLDGGIPAIQGELGGIDSWLRIDTGASLFETSDVYVNVPEHLWKALCRRHEGLAPETWFQGTGAGGRAVDLPVAALPGARIGPLELERVFVIVQPEVGYFAASDARGFVSNNFLRRLGRVTLDYRNGRLRTAHP